MAKSALPSPSELIQASYVTPEQLERIGEDVAASLRSARAEAARVHRTEEERTAPLLPPASNTGGKSSVGSAGQEIPSRFLMVDGKPMEVPARRGYGADAAFVDWVNFTCQEEAFWRLGVKPGQKTYTPVVDSDVVEFVSVQCLRIFGFGITSRREGGANFYRDSYVLGDGWGMVCHGGQRGTVLVTLSGQGCAAAAPGWEARLQLFLEESSPYNSRITRCDLSYDDYDGEMDIEDLDMMYEAGLFNCGGRMPDIEFRGNWKRPNGKGRTVYVGNRKNGKFFRGYEKGKQLGDPTSPWVRLECELKSVDRMIPFDVLTRAGQYLAATYPALGFISRHQERILTTQKTMQVAYKSMVGWLKTQAGAAINAMLEIEGTAEAVISAIRRDAIPSRLKVPDYRLGGATIETRERVFLPEGAALDAPFQMGAMAF